MSQRYDVREQITKIESITGTGTELVTVTVPADKQLNAVQTQIQQEHAEAEHIKSDTTRRNVQQALQRIDRILTGYDETPANGLILYAGVVDGDVTSYVFDDLPVPLHTSTYQCGDHFNTDPLTAVTTPEDTYGLLVVERGGAAIGRLLGERVTPIHTLDSNVMGKTRAGGQSAQRFKRERERQKHEFFKEIGTIANTEFTGDDTVTGVAVGGTLGTATEFADGDYLDYRLRDRLIGTYPVAYGNEQGLEELVSKAQTDLLDDTHQRERDVLDAFFTRLRTDDSVAYGFDAVSQAIDYGAVETLIAATTIDSEQREAIADRVQSQGGETVVVSSNTDRGERFADTFTIAALLRFKIN